MIGTQTSFNEMCSCQSTPAHVYEGHILSLNNHGNCVQLYTDTECLEGLIEISGGSSAKTKNSAWLSKQPIKSVRPCEKQLGCWILTSSIYKIEINNIAQETMEEIIADSNDFELATTSVFLNNGSAEVSQSYSATKEITETVEIYKGKAFSEMERVYTEDEYEYNANLNLGGKRKFSAGPFSYGGGFDMQQRFFDAFTKEQNSSEETSEKYITTKSQRFSVSQDFVIPACSIYEVYSSIKFKEGYKVNYTIFAKVTGSENGNDLTAELVRPKIQSMHVTGDDGDRTVFATFEQQIKADFGFETEIVGNGQKIPGCQK